jgi:glycosyltransferase involved in cell wall biosynthesis
MAAGLPAVASRVGGIPEIAAEGSEALLVPPGEVAATAAAVGRLLDEPVFAAGLAAAAQARVRRDFAPERVARRSLEIYRRLAAAEPA